MSETQMRTYGCAFLSLLICGLHANEVGWHCRVIGLRDHVASR
jgi:hypothetical protein